MTLRDITRDVFLKCGVPARLVSSAIDVADRGDDKEAVAESSVDVPQDKEQAVRNGIQHLLLTGETPEGYDAMLRELIAASKRSN